MLFFIEFERPLPVKADVQILTLEISLPSDRYTPVSGHQADTMSRGRYRPKADILKSLVLFFLVFHEGFPKS